VEVVVKKVGDQPYVTELLSAGMVEYLIGGSPEWVHLGGKIHACVNESGLVRGLPYNACGFVGDFIFAALLESGKVGVMSEGDKRRVFKWYEAHKDMPPPDLKASVHDFTLEEFEKHSEAAQEAYERRNHEWRSL